MSKYILQSLVIAMTILLLIACKDTMKEAKVYTEQSDLIKVVEDKEQLANLSEAWKNKQKTLEKLLPLFEYKVELSIDGDKQVWLFNKAGYLKQEGGNTLYKTDKKDILAQLVD